MHTYVIMPITSSIGDIVSSSIVNLVSSLPRTVNGSHICVPFKLDDPIPPNANYVILDYDAWSALQVTAEWLHPTEEGVTP